MQQGIYTPSTLAEEEYCDILYSICCFIPGQKMWFYFRGTQLCYLSVQQVIPDFLFPLALCLLTEHYVQTDTHTHTHKEKGGLRFVLMWRQMPVDSTVAYCMQNDWNSEYKDLMRHPSGPCQTGAAKQNKTNKKNQPWSHFCFSNKSTHRNAHTQPLTGPKTCCPQPPSPLILHSGQEVVSW